MLINLFRVTILYFVIIVSMRVLGKRQIGELQPAELVITILISAIVAIPMQDTGMALMNSVIPVLMLVGFEIIVSVISLKSIKFRSVLQGNPLVVIRNGVLDQEQLKRLRFTMDDLLEALRKKDVFDISTVWYAIVETDGTLSVLLKSPQENVKNADLNLTVTQENYQPSVIIDGRIIKTELKECSTDMTKFQRLLRKKNIDVKGIMLMTLDKSGNMNIIKKDKKQ